MRPSGIKRLNDELRQIKTNGLEGATVKLANDDNIDEWEVGIFGPPGTPYEGGYFKLTIIFPSRYPDAPPDLRFHTRMWHPNIYIDGRVCMSILNKASGWQLGAAYASTLSVEVIILSVIVLLSNPNLDSVADFDAACMYRNWISRRGDSQLYSTILRDLVDSTQRTAARDNVRVPKTVDEYTASGCQPDSTYCNHDHGVSYGGMFWRYLKQLTNKLRRLL